MKKDDSMSDGEIIETLDLIFAAGFEFGKANLMNTKESLEAARSLLNRCVELHPDPDKELLSMQAGAVAAVEEAASASAGEASGDERELEGARDPDDPQPVLLHARRAQLGLGRAQHGAGEVLVEP